MSFQTTEPILIIGLGGVGSKLAIEASQTLESECLLISNNQKDFSQNHRSVKVSTDSIINPSVQLIRGSSYKVFDEIESKIANFSTIVLMANLAGKAGAAISPVVSEICLKSGKNLISFVIMPFKYEKERIFHSGVSLKRIQKNSKCTVILDNDSLLENNPDLTPKTCYEIANKAIIHVVGSLKTLNISTEINILAAGKSHENIEDSLKDSLKILYDNVPESKVKKSILYVAGGEDIPVGIINSISNLTRGILTEGDSEVNLSSSNESKVLLLSSIQGDTKFERYDPLGIIPLKDTLDWTYPDCSIDYKFDLYQLE